MQFKISGTRFEATKALLPQEERAFSSIMSRMLSPQGGIGLEEGKHLQEVYIFPEVPPHVDIAYGRRTAIPRGTVYIDNSGVDIDLTGVKLPDGSNIHGKNVVTCPESKLWLVRGNDTITMKGTAIIVEAPVVRVEGGNARIITANSVYAEYPPDTKKARIDTIQCRNSVYVAGSVKVEQIQSIGDNSSITVGPQAGVKFVNGGDKSSTINVKGNVESVRVNGDNTLITVYPGGNIEEIKLNDKVKNCTLCIMPGAAVNMEKMPDGIEVQYPDRPSQEQPAREIDVLEMGVRVANAASQYPPNPDLVKTTPQPTGPAALPTPAHPGELVLSGAER